MISAPIYEQKAVASERTNEGWSLCNPANKRHAGAREVPGGFGFESELRELDKILLRTIMLELTFKGTLHGQTGLAENNDALSSNVPLLRYKFLSEYGTKLYIGQKALDSLEPPMATYKPDLEVEKAGIFLHEIDFEKYSDVVEKNHQIAYGLKELLGNEWDLAQENRNLPASMCVDQEQYDILHIF